MYTVAIHYNNGETVIQEIEDTKYTIKKFLERYWLSRVFMKKITWRKLHDE